MNLAASPAARGASARPRFAGEIPVHSERLCRWFRRYLRGYFRRNFSGVRVSRASPVLADLDGPLLVYANHPSWWDPIHFSLIAAFEIPGRRVFGPMDADALEKYAFFKKLGVFGIERTRRGAVRFIRTAAAILDARDASLWVTAQGRFSDPRARPLDLQPGIAHLARKLEGAWVVPLAVEYPFWNERHPEALSRFGEPIRIGHGGERSTAEWSALFEQRLAETMDGLCTDASTRDPDRFRTLVAGRTGVGGTYDLWRRLRAWARGQRFRAAHGDEERGGS